MYRVYRLIGTDRYYWRSPDYWTEWSWEAEPLTLARALQVAQLEGAYLERLHGAERKIHFRRR